MKKLSKMNITIEITIREALMSTMKDRYCSMAYTADKEQDTIDHYKWEIKRFYEVIDALDELGYSQYLQDVAKIARDSYRYKIRR